jgi:hypothetical protein
LYGTDAVASGIGCKGQWQAITGNYDYEYYEDGVNKVGTKTGLVQTKTEVYLLESAQWLSLGFTFILMALYF